jgi:hypothetical protein
VLHFSDASFGRPVQSDGASITLTEGQLDTLAIALKAHARNLEGYASDAMRIERRECEEILAMIGETLEDE